MTTLAVVRKGGVAAIAADTLYTQGSCKVPFDNQRNSSKLIRVGKSHVGVSGSKATVRVFESLARRHAAIFELHSVGDVFETFRKLHKILVDEYHLMTKEDDDEQPYESSQTFLLIANSSGIYEVQGYREVSEYERYWAIGSGDEFALGALEALFGDRRLGARALARKAVEIACTFDKSSATPVEVKTVRLSRA